MAREKAAGALSDVALRAVGDRRAGRGSGVFIEDPSLFAINRSARFLGYSVEQSTGRLVYTPDGKPVKVEY